MNLNIKEQFVITSSQRFVLFNISLRRHSLKCIHVPFMMLMYKKHFPFPYYCRCLMLENAHVLLCMFIVSLNLSIKVNQSFSLLNLWDIEHQFIELRLISTFVQVCTYQHDFLSRNAISQWNLILINHELFGHSIQIY